MLFCLSCVALLLGAQRLGFRPGVAIAKLGAAASFVVFALQLGALDSEFGRRVLLGLCLCATGDALLLPSGQTRWFQLGIASFLLGHLAYAAAFVRFPLPAMALIAGSVALAAFGLAAWRWLAPSLPPDFRLPVVAYVGVICAMVVTAVAATAGGAPAAVAAGAIGFAVSDLSVARDRFVAPGFVNGAWGLPLYFGAQLLLASTVTALPDAVQG